MKSNGFGSVEQETIVHVDKQYADEVAAILGVAPFKETTNPDRAYFEWRRWMRRRGNEETRKTLSLNRDKR